MDTFMDKIAQKFNAQEIIKANSEAEERELRKLREQIAEYDTRLQEIRKLNLKNLEIADKLEAMIEANQPQQESDDSEKQKQQEQQELQLQKLKEIAASTAELNSALIANQADNAANLDAIHKECVKVYRNVQAVVDQGLLSQTMTLSEQNMRIEKKTKGLKPIGIIGLIVAVANLAVLVCHVLGIL